MEEKIKALLWDFDYKFYVARAESPTQKEEDDKKIEIIAQATSQLKALFVEIPESLKKKAIEELNKMTDSIYRGCQKYYIHALDDVRARIKGGAK